MNVKDDVSQNQQPVKCWICVKNKMQSWWWQEDGVSE